MDPQYGSRMQYAFRIANSFQCYFTGSESLICESFEKCDKLEIPIFGSVPNQWVHLAVAGNKVITDNKASYLQFETGSSLIA